MVLATAHWSMAFGFLLGATALTVLTIFNWRHELVPGYGANPPFKWVLLCTFVTASMAVICLLTAIGSLFARST